MSINAATSPKSRYKGRGYALGVPIRPAKDNFCENFDLFRREADLTWGDIADALKVSRSTISYWKTGRSQPSYEDMDALAKLFRKSVQDFFEDPTEPRTKRPVDLETALRIVAAAAKRGRDPS